MAVQSEASVLGSSCELGDKVNDFVKTDFVLVVFLIPPTSFGFTKNSKTLSRINVRSLI